MRTNRIFHSRSLPSEVAGQRGEILPVGENLLNQNATLRRTCASESWDDRGQLPRGSTIPAWGLARHPSDHINASGSLRNFQERAGPGLSRVKHRGANFE